MSTHNIPAKAVNVCICPDEKEQQIQIERPVPAGTNIFSINSTLVLKS